jgi:hypothetical protein
VSTRLLFEGPSLADVLARVRSEHGASARIVSADRVRSGGFAGFFSKETYAITVEIGAGSADGSSGCLPVDAPGSLLDLADAISSAEAMETAIALGTATPPPGRPPAPAPRRDLPPPRVSTENPYFAEVLAKWASSADAPPPPTPAAPLQVSRPDRVERGGRTEEVRRLAALGVPVEVLSALDAGAGLVAALRAALPPLPLPEGGRPLSVALVEATAKPGDLADALATMGPLDGLAVRSTAATRDPATVLRVAIDLGLPTVWLEDRTGDAEAWAQLLLARVAAAPPLPGRHRRAD